MDDGLEAAPFQQAGIRIAAGVDEVRRGHPWSLPLSDRILLVATYGRANLTMRQLAPLFGVSTSAAGRIVDHLGPLLALRPARCRRRTGEAVAPAVADAVGARPVRVAVMGNVTRTRSGGSAVIWRHR